VWALTLVAEDGAMRGVGTVIDAGLRADLRVVYLVCLLVMEALQVINDS